ncbi:MAG: PaaI family thioesterase [Mangrovicoccus sp.]|nr:PaaI family thioesterase [Mangrovicoccus sp.]
MDQKAKLSPREKLQSQSGLEVMQSFCEMPQSDFAKLMGFNIIGAAPGEAIVRASPGPEHCNLFGGVHGGWYGSVLDTALGCAVMTRLEAGYWYTTLEYKINVTRPARPGVDYIATGTAQHVGRSTGVSSAELRGAEDGKLYATASTTCLVMKA